MLDSSASRFDPAPSPRWTARLARVAEQLIEGNDNRPGSERLFELIAADLRLDVFVHHEVTAEGLRLLASRGVSDVDIAHFGPHVADTGIAGRVAREARPLYLAEVQDSDEAAVEFARDIGLLAYVCIPIMIRDRVVGTVGYGRRWSSRFERDELDFLEVATSWIASIDRHRRSLRRLEANEERLRLALELGGLGSFDWDLLTGEGSASEGCYSIFGYGAETMPTYSNVLKAVLPEDSERFRADVNAALRGGESFRSEVRIGRAGDGHVRWIRIDGGVVRDGRGRATRMVGIVRDVTERREAQEREHLLSREVDHRAKNLLTVVQSVVQLTRADDIEDFREAVSGRIQALGRAHSLLAASRWEGAELSTLVREEAAPFGELAEHVRAEGPPVLLRPAAAQSIAIVLHELATNAVKYGGLSTPAGRVDVQWHLERGAAERLVLHWRETGGPPAVAPARPGFGTTVIEASVNRQLGGHVRHDWREEGLVCEIVVPARQLAVAGEPEPEDESPAITYARRLPPRCAKVLVVEDEPLITLQIVQMLERLGCQVVGPAATVGEALDLINAGAFDLALLDVDLQGSRSFPLADLLDDKGRRFAFLSGFGAAELPQRFQGAPLLAKPICKHELEAIVHAAGETQDTRGMMPAAGE